MRLGLESLEARETPAVVGTLDPTFGAGGTLIAPSGIFSSGGQTAVVDPAGRTLITGSDSQLGLFVTRRTADGAVDTTFGTGGEVHIPVAGQVVGARLAVDAAGGIALVGQGGTPGEAVVARLTATGAPDPSFGTGGVETLPIPAGFTGLFAQGVTIDPAGKVVLVGSAGADRFIVRLSSTGVIDPTFNGGAVTLVSGTSGHPSTTGAVSVDSAGRIVAAGDNGFDSGWWVVRLAADGSLDPSFAGTGVASLPTPGASFESANVIQQIVTGAAGNVYVGANLGGPVVIKLTAGGSPDATFGSGGRFNSPPGPRSFDSRVGGLAVLPDGRVLVGQTVLPSLFFRYPSHENNEFRVLLVTPGGQLDPSFNPHGLLPGTATVGFGALQPYLSSLSVTPAGDVIVAGIAGYSSAQTHPSLVVARLALATGTEPQAPANPFPGFDGLVRAASADVDGDGVLDAILASGPGMPARVAVVSGADNSVLVAPFDPFGGDFTGGGFVSAADLDGDGRAEVVVTADQGGGARVVVLGRNADGTVATRASFLGIADPDFRGGARTAVADVNRDGTPDLIVAAGVGGGPRVAVFDGGTLLGGTPTRLVNDFFAFPGADAVTLRNGVFVSAGDVDGDGFADLIFGGGPGGAPRVIILSGKLVTAEGVPGAYAAPVANYFVGGDGAARDGIRVGVISRAANGRADVVVGNAGGTPTAVTVYPGQAFTGTTDPASSFPLDPKDGGGLAQGLYEGSPLRGRRGQPTGMRSTQVRGAGGAGR